MVVRNRAIIGGMMGHKTLMQTGGVSTQCRNVTHYTTETQEESIHILSLSFITMVDITGEVSKMTQKPFKFPLEEQRELFPDMKHDSTYMYDDDADC